MFDILCSLPLSSELFAQALNPVEPLLAVGLASGHVETFRLPVDDDKHTSQTSASSGQDDDDDDDDDDDNTSQATGGRRSSLSSRSSPTPLITSAWRTRRHHGSCRALAYSAVDGAYLFSGGSDGLVKCADSATGRVIAKIAVPRPANARPASVSAAFDAPSVLHALTPTTLLVAGDSGAVHLYDTRTGSSGGLSSSSSSSTSKAKAPSTSASTSILAARPAATWTPHGDYVSGIAAVPASGTSTSGLPRAFLSVGAGSLALTDVRKGVVATVAEGAQLLTGVAVSTGGNGGRVVAGDAAGGLTSWDRGAVATWGLGGGRVRVHVTRALVTPEGDSMPVPGLAEGEDAGIEVLCAVPAGSEAERELGEDAVVLGWDSGRVEVVALKGKGKGRAKAAGGAMVAHEGQPATRGSVVADFPPDVGGEGVAAVGFDAVGRLVVAAGDKVTIYAQMAQTAVDWAGEEGVDEAGDDSDDDDDDDDGDDIMDDAAPGVKRPAQGSSAEDESSEEEEKQKPKHKKKKKKGKTQKNHLSFGLSGID